MDQEQQAASFMEVLDVLLQLLKESRIEGERMARVEVKIDNIAGLETRISALENDRSKAIGWAAGVSAGVSVAVAVLIWLLTFARHIP